MNVERARLRLRQDRRGIAGLDRASLENLAECVDPFCFYAIRQHAYLHLQESCVKLPETLAADTIAAPATTPLRSQSQQRDRDQGNEHVDRLERPGRRDQEMTEAFGRGDHFGEKHHDAGNHKPDAAAGQDRRHRRRQHHLEQDLTTRRARGHRRPDQLLLDHRRAVIGRRAESETARRPRPTRSSIHGRNRAAATVPDTARPSATAPIRARSAAPRR